MITEPHSTRFEPARMVIAHLVLGIWLLVTLASITALLAPPHDSVLWRGAVIIVIALGCSMALELAQINHIARLALLTMLIVFSFLLLTGADPWFNILDAVTQLRSMVTQLPDAIITDRPPLEAAPVWGVAVLLAFTVITLFTIVLAVDARGAAEALVPGVIFISIISLVVEFPSAGYSIAAVFIAMVTATTLRWRRQPAIAAGAGPDRTGPDRSGLDRLWLAAPLISTVALAIIVAIAATLAGPRLPGAQAAPLIDGNERSGGVTTVASPLVDIGAQLTNLSDTEMFTMRASSASYWRLAALPVFDGSTFRIPTSPLTPLEQPVRSGRVIEQELEIIELSGRLVPVAADPIRARGEAVRWSAESQSLVRTDRNLTSGDRFALESVRPSPNLNTLSTASSVSPPDPEIVLPLPANFPTSAIATAQTVTAEARSGYEQALALQFWFRDEFTYSLEAPGGHGIEAIERFLDVRQGFCEQFAASFAALARTLGLPSRVAVGFTSGIAETSARLDPADTSTNYLVLGRHAHAWPEIWFDDVGWVPFEPTPGRGAPDAEQFTGVAPAQAPDIDTDIDEPAIGDTEPQGAPASNDPDLDALAQMLPPDQGGAVRPEADQPRSMLLQVALGLLAVCGGLIMLRRWHRRRLANAPIDEQVSRAWRTTCRNLERAGLRGTPSMTSGQWTTMAAQRFPSVERPMSALAGAYDRCLFAADIDHRPGPYGHHLGRQARQWARQIDAFVRLERQQHRRHTQSESPRQQVASDLTRDARHRAKR